MSDLTISIPHHLTRDEVKRRIRQHIALARSKPGSLLTNMQETWTEDAMSFSLTALGQSITGNLTLHDQEVRLTVALPWLLRTLASPFIKSIEQQGRLLLG